MTELDDHEREALRAYAVARTPDAARRGQALAAVSARIASGPVSLESSGAGASGVSSSKLLLGFGLGLAVVIAGAAVVISGSSTDLEARAERVEGNERPEVVTVEPRSAAERSVEQHPPALPEGPEEIAVPEEQDQPEEAERGAASVMKPARGQRKRKRGTTPRTKGKAPDELKPPASTLHAEMKLVASGQSALKRGDPKRALEIFDQHARRYPDGLLAEERTVKRLVALCELGRRAKARRAAKSFLKKHPKSPLAGHAAKICVE